MTEKCAVCNEVMSVENTIAKGQSNRWVAWPPVITGDGRTGHTECFIREGTVSLGGRTGPEFADELDAGVLAHAPLGTLATPKRDGIFYLDVMKRLRCSCDDPGDGPCPRHGKEMAAQDERIAEENRRKLRASVGKEFLTAGPPLVHEGFKAILDEIEAERDWTPGDPNTPGIYAIVVCWDPCEGMFPNVSTWDGVRWVRPPGPISFYRGPFATEAEAWAWAEVHDPEEVTRPKHLDHEVTVTIPPGASADITIVHQPDGSVKADVQFDRPVTVFTPADFAPRKGMISRGPIFEADTTKDPIVIRPLTQAAADIMDQAPIALLPPGPDYSKLVDSDAFDRAFEEIVRGLGLPTEYLAAPGQEVFFVEYKVPALTGDKVHAQGPYLTKHIAQGHYEDIFNFEGVEQVEIVGRPNVHAPHPGQEMLDGAARGKIQDALRTIDRTARAIQKKQEGKTHGYVLPENASAYRRLCDNLGIPWEEVTEEPKEP